MTPEEAGRKRYPPSTMETLLAIVGPTAVGKSAVASRVAPALGADILSIDSMQVYRGMDIGTAKPGPGERSRVRFHLIDIADPGERFSAALFKRRALEALSSVIEEGRVPLLVGGSGLYYRAFVDDLDFEGVSPVSSGGEAWDLVGLDTHELHGLLEGLDPAAACEIPPGNRRRVIRAIEAARGGGRLVSERQRSWSEYRSPYRLAAAGLDMDRGLLYRLIDDRVDDMFESGLVDEVRNLAGRGGFEQSTAAEALGYRQVLDHLRGDLTLEQAVSETKRRTRNFAKRQLTWFGRDPRIRWFTVEGSPSSSMTELERSLESAAALVLQYFRQVSGV